MVSKSEELQNKINQQKADMEAKRKAFEEQHKKAREDINKVEDSVDKDRVIDANNMVKKDNIVYTQEEFLKKIKEKDNGPIIFDEADQFAKWGPEDAELKPLRPSREDVEKLRKKHFENVVAQIKKNTEEINSAVEKSRAIEDKITESIDTKKNDIEKKKIAKKKELTAEYEDKVSERKKEYQDDLQTLKDELKEELEDNHDDYSPSDIREAKESKQEEMDELKDELDEDLETYKEEFEEELEEALEEIDEEADDYFSSTTRYDDINFNPSIILKVALGFIGVGITMIVGYQVFTAMSETISMDASLINNTTAIGDAITAFPLGLFILLLGPIVLLQILKMIQRNY